MSEAGAAGLAKHSKMTVMLLQDMEACMLANGDLIAEQCVCFDRSFWGLRLLESNTCKLASMYKCEPGSPHPCSSEHIKRLHEVHCIVASVLSSMLLFRS